MRRNLAVRGDVGADRELEVRVTGRERTGLGVGAGREEELHSLHVVGQVDVHVDVGVEGRGRLNVHAEGRANGEEPKADVSIETLC